MLFSYPGDIAQFFVKKTRKLLYIFLHIKQCSFLIYLWQLNFLLHKQETFIIFLHIKQCSFFIQVWQPVMKITFHSMYSLNFVRPHSLSWSEITVVVLIYLGLRSLLSFWYMYSLNFVRPHSLSWSEITVVVLIYLGLRSLLSFWYISEQQQWSQTKINCVV